MASVGSAAAGKTLVGAGIGSSPAFADIGTNSGLTNHGVVIAKGNGAFVATTAGTIGQVLTSNGAGSDPTFQTVSSSIGTINGDTGSITGSTVTIFANTATQNAGSTVSFDNTGTVSTFNVQDANLNTIIGKGAGNATLTGQSNTGLGRVVLASLTDSSGNTAIGDGALVSLTTGSGGNTAIGTGALLALVDGAFNIGIGIAAGSEYTGTETHNICIGNLGLLGESATIRIGTILQQTRCFLQGISEVTVAASSPALVTMTGQLSDLGFGASGQLLQSSGSGVSTKYTTATYPTSATSAGKVLISNGTNWVESTPTFPNASATTRKIIVSDGTNWVASTETYAVPGTSGNLLTSDGTNWTSAAPAAKIAVFAYINAASVADVTGDGTVYTVIFDATSVNIGAAYSTGTGIFTAPATGNYLVTAHITYQQLGALFTAASLNIVASSGFTLPGLINPGVLQTGGNCSQDISAIVTLAATQTVRINIFVSGSTKTIDLAGNSSGVYSHLSIAQL